MRDQNFDNDEDRVRMHSDINHVEANSTRVQDGLVRIGFGPDDTTILKGQFVFAWELFDRRTGSGMIGDVPFYDAKEFASDIDFHIWNGKTRCHPDTLLTAQRLAFARLLHGLATEASRTALQRMLVDSIVVQIILRPDRGLALVRTIELAGFQYEELRRAPIALRLMCVPGAISLIACVGRRSGAYKDVLRRLSDEVEQRPEGMTPEIMLQTAKTLHTSGDPKGAVEFLRRATAIRPTVDGLLLLAMWVHEMRLECMGNIVMIFSNARDRLRCSDAVKRAKFEYRLARFYDTAGDMFMDQYKCLGVWPPTVLPLGTANARLSSFFPHSRTHTS